MLRIAMIYVGVLIGLIAGGVGGLTLMDKQSFWEWFDPNRFHRDLVGSTLLYVVVPLSGIAGGGTISLLTRPLRKMDDPSAIGVAFAFIAGVGGAFLTICLSIVVFLRIDPHPNEAAIWGEGLSAFFVLGPAGGLVTTLVTYKLLKKSNRRETRSARPVAVALHPRRSDRSV